MAETTEQYRARINQLKTSIENEPLIKKMRDDIAEGVSKTGNRQADIEVQFQSVIDGTTGKDVISAPEIIAARNGETNLKTRLDKKEQEVTAQLAQTMTQTEFDSWVSTLLDGGPSIFMETLSALESAYPNGSSGVALVRSTDPSRIYIWDGVKWTDYGSYQGQELKNKSVSNAKLADKNITPDKISQVVRINRNDLPIYSEGKYVTETGTLTTLSTWNVRYYELPSSLKKLSLFGTTSTIRPIILYDDGSKYIVPNENKVNIINTHKGKLLLNENKANQGSEITSIEIEFSKEGYASEDFYDVIGEKTLFDKGYNQDGQSKFAVGFSQYKVMIDKNRKYKAELSSSIKGGLFKSDDSLIENLQVDLNGYIEVKDGDYFIVNIGANDNVYSEPKEISLLSNKNYPTSVKKPYQFQGKNNSLFGTSISLGNTGTEIIPNPWIKQFSERVGMTSVNNAISASLYTGGYNGVQTIVSKAKTTDLNPFDILFFDGPTNDYGLQADLTLFKSSIEDLCSYLKVNYTGEVIFINAINRQRVADNEVHKLDEYRNIFAETVLSNGYSLINGKDFPIPTEYGNYQNTIMPDGLHLLYEGHVIYTNTVATILT